MYFSNEPCTSKPKHGAISQWLNSHGCTLWTRLGRLSMYIYLLHVPVILFCKHLIVMDNCITGSMLILAVTVAFCLLAAAVRESPTRA